jgi:hypothetical protein
MCVVIESYRSTVRVEQATMASHGHRNEYRSSHNNRTHAHQTTAFMIAAIPTILFAVVMMIVLL